MRGLWYAVAGTSVAIGMAGTVIPLLPTTPFVLIGGYAAARASPCFLRWMLRHPMLGPTLRNWHRHGAIPRRAKLLAGASLMFSAAVTVAAFDDPRVWIGVFMILTVVAAYIFTRPGH